MSVYAIKIYGVGPHHSNRPEIDADAMAKTLVDALKSTGHDVKYAVINFGSSDVLNEISGVLQREELHREDPAIGSLTRRLDRDIEVITGLQAQVEDLTATSAQVPDLQAQIADLQAQLAAATKPKGDAS